MSMIGQVIRRPVTVFMITIGFLVFGLIALGKLPINLLPDLSYPTLTIETRYPGAAPEEVEYLLTRPIEEAVSVIPNIQRVSSSSKAEVSQVTLEFDWGRNMDFAILDVSKKIDLIRFPEEIEKPRILRYDPNQEPIMKVSVTSDQMPLEQLRFFGEEDLKKRLEGTPGLASVKVSGGREEIIEVHLDETKLKRFGLTVSEVSRRLTEENINRAGGSLYENDARYLVRTLNEFKTLEEIGDTIVSRQEGKKVYLREVADIAYGHKDIDRINRINGGEGIELAFYKEGDANTVLVSKNLDAAIDKYAEEFKDQVTMVKTYKGATFIESAVEEVKSNAVIGGLIAIVVLFLFLWDVKSTLIIGVAIPISVVTTFFLMLLFDVSLNIMSLGGLALGVGMLVDNAIVVLESIAVRKKLGDDDFTAAEKGTGTVAGAVFASTLTTVVVFVPIVFVQGVAGQLFRDLGLAVSFALIASLIAALTFMPAGFVMLGRMVRFVKSLFVDVKKLKDGSFYEEDKEQHTSLEELEVGDFKGNLYTKMLTGALRLRYLVLLVAVLLVFQAGTLWKTLGLNLVPELAQGDYYVLMEMEEGTPIQSTDQAANFIEEQLVAMDEVKVVFSNVGEFNQGLDTRSGENLAQINFSLKEGVENQIPVLARIRNILEEAPNMDYHLGTPSYFSFRTPIEVEIYEDNREILEQINQEFMTEMAKLESIKDIRSTVADGNPEIQIQFDRETMSKLGLSIADTAALLRDKIQGTTPTRFVRSGRDVDIMVRLEEDDRAGLDQLDDLTIAYRDGRPIYLRTVAHINYETGPSQIKRITQSRCAVISANLSNNDLGAAAAAVTGIIENMRNKYDGIEIKLSGQTQEMDSSMRSLLFVIGLATFLVYLVMASQFESLVHPFLILLTVPIGLAGGLFALYVTGLELSVIALIGLVMLAGIVVNNAIVLIDYINQLRRAGKPLYDSLIIAGNRRLRPIMMTTTTTVLGLLPMALGLGSGAEMRTPLAVTVIGGLLLSTILTLVIIPALYSLVHRGLKLPGREEQPVAEEVTA